MGNRHSKVSTVEYTYWHTHSEWMEHQGEENVDEPVRMICPDCNLIYRLKQPVPGKQYSCRQCGSELEMLSEPLESPIATDAASANGGSLAAPVADQPLAARLAPPPPEIDLQPGSGQGGTTYQTELASVSEQIRGLENRLAGLGGQRMDYQSDFASLSNQLRNLENRLTGLGERLNPDKLTALSGQIREAGENLVSRLAAERREHVTGIAEALRDADLGDLSTRLADEIGRVIEDKVTGPVNDLAKQNAVAGEDREERVAAIVSNSVAEAQRPLIREVVAKRRSGVPAWLFAAVLLPLLFVLGYLLLPGDLLGLKPDRQPSQPAVSQESVDPAALTRMETRLAAMSESLRRLETDGIPVPGEVEEKLKNIDTVSRDIHAQALAHAENAGALAEEVKNLRQTIAQRDTLLKEYNETLQRQSRRLRAYETRLTGMGVSPDSVEE